MKAYTIDDGRWQPCEPRNATHYLLDARELGALASFALGAIGVPDTARERAIAVLEQLSGEEYPR